MSDSRETISSGGGLRVLGPMSAGYDRILTPEALGFVTDLLRRFDGRRRELLLRRIERQKEIDAGVRAFREVVDAVDRSRGDAPHL